MDNIDITGVDRATLIAGLHNHTCALGWGMLQDIGRDITPAEVTEVMGKRLEGAEVYIDYFMGHPLKVSISGSVVNTDALYDRDAGRGQFARVLEKARRGAWESVAK